LDNDYVDNYRVLFAVDRNRRVVGMYYRTAETGTFVPPGQGFSDMIYYASTDPHWPYSEDDGKEDLREMGRAGVDDTDTVGFSVNSEAAYTAVMQRFGHLVDHDETSGIMYAPARVWPQIEMTAFDADGEGATRDDGIDESGDVEDFLARGGKITQVKPNKGPRYPGTSLGSKHIGTTRGGKASTISGKNANTRATVKPVVAVEADRNEMDTPEFQAAIAKMKKRHAQDDQNFNLDKARELGKKLAARGAAERKTKGVDEDSWHDGQNAWSSENNQWSNESVEDRRLNRLIEYRLAEMRRAGYDI
jgi:hypothetical protein